MSGARPRSGLRLVALGLVLGVALAASNPGPERHRRSIREAIAKREPVAGALGLGFLKSRFPDYHSLIVCSYTTLDGRVTSLGALGLVWVDYESLTETE